MQFVLLLSLACLSAILKTSNSKILAKEFCKSGDTTVFLRISRTKVKIGQKCNVAGDAIDECTPEDGEPIKAGTRTNFGGATGKWLSLECRANGDTFVAENTGFSEDVCGAKDKRASLYVINDHNLKSEKKILMKFKCSGSGKTAEITSCRPEEKPAAIAAGQEEGWRRLTVTCSQLHAPNLVARNIPSCDNGPYTKFVPVPEENTKVKIQIKCNTDEDEVVECTPEDSKAVKAEKTSKFGIGPSGKWLAISCQANGEISVSRNGNFADDVCATSEKAANLYVTYIGNSEEKLLFKFECAKSPQTIQTCKSDKYPNAIQAGNSEIWGAYKVICNPLKAPSVSRTPPPLEVSRLPVKKDNAVFVKIDPKKLTDE